MGFSCHNMLYGPTGTGGLYVGPRAEPRSWREGDAGGDSPKELIHPREWPSRLEGGTPNTRGIVGLAAGIAWIRERGPGQSVANSSTCSGRWSSGSDGWRIAGRWEPERHIDVPSLIPPEGQDPKEITKRVAERYGISTLSGHQGSFYLNKAPGSYPNGTLRICPGPFVMAADMARLIEGLDAVALAESCI